MQLTRNVSLFRLLSATVDAVVANRDEFGGLGIVGCEILPHLDKHDASFLEKVRKYSELVLDEIVAVEDGGALVVDGCGDFKCFGTAVAIPRAVRSPIEAAAAHPACSRRRPLRLRGALVRVTATAVSECTRAQRISTSVRQSSLRQPRGPLSCRLPYFPEGRRMCWTAKRSRRLSRQSTAMW